MKRKPRYLLLLAIMLAVLMGCGTKNEQITITPDNSTQIEKTSTSNNIDKSDNISNPIAISKKEEDKQKEEDNKEYNKEDNKEDNKEANKEANKEDNKVEIKDELLKIHFIDVGQADCILIQLGEYACLIDGGNNSDGELVSNYLRDNNVTKLDYVIGTHPHEDHVGGLDIVINNYDVERVLLPEFTLATKTFKDVLDAIENKNLKITKPIVGDTYNLGDASFIIIAPNKEDYGENPNNYSIGIKLTYGKTTFLSVGDAELEAEKDMLNNGIDLEADIFKVSHHGSHTSNSEEFLKAVDPVYAVISVGRDNSYGHPNSNVITSMLEDDVMLYRTDENGTIIITSDGKNLSFETITTVEVKNNKPNKTEDKVVYITGTGEKYHIDGCRFLANSKIKTTLSQVIENGYTPCKVCDPPTK